MKKIPIEAATIDLREIAPLHRKVLRGLLRRNPTKTLSAVIAMAISPFCEANKDAAAEIEIQIETRTIGHEKAPV